MKTFLTILVILGVAGYNIWVHYYNNDVNKYNKALRNFENKLYDKSFLVFEKLCNEKDWADACDMLGRHYEFGYAVKKDEIKSARLYQKACDMGDDNGCTDLALNYYEGIGVKQDENKAIEMLNNLCDIKHNKNACDTLKEISNASSDNTQYEQTSTAVATSQSQITVQNNEISSQADFLAAVSAGTIPNEEIKGDIKALESKLKEALNDVEAVISDRMNKFNKVQNEWQKYIALKRKVVNMLGLDGDEAYKQEYVFWTDWLKYFATDMI